MKLESSDSMHSRWRDNWNKREDVQKLWRAPEYKRAISTLAGKPRRSLFADIPLDLAVTRAVMQGLAEPDIAETMTASQRRKQAEQIKRATQALWDAMEPFLREDDAGFGWPFQPHLDALALDISIEDEKRWNHDNADVEEIVHRTRFAVYFLVMQRMDSWLNAIDAGADHFAESETVLKKPNDPNAKRLYFLRVLTRIFVSEFRSPMRGATLALASIFFNCDDLDEAAISKIAPVIKPKPVEISQEEFEGALASIEESRDRYLAKGGDPKVLDEINEHLSKMREKARESSG